jgi:NAD(P)-dependent dehydrogenase (short-subunit alcohol dehydrogenase family)
MNHLSAFSLAGKTAIITGASKGIGKAIAQILGKAGANIVVSSRNQEALDEVAAELMKEGIMAIGIAANAGKTSDLINLVEKTVAAFGGVDIIVNNAATNPVFGALETVDERAIDKIMDVNLKGPFLLAKAAFPELQKRGGSIINISSVEGVTPSHGLGMYSVSKAALLMLTKSMAVEWGRHKIRVNAICPGLIQTKFSEALWTNEKIMKMMMQKVPLGRMGQPEEMAGLALFLASDAGAYCTGGVYVADGGFLV